MSEKRQVVGSMSKWSGVLKDFFRQIADGSINLNQVQAFLEHRKELEPQFKVWKTIKLGRSNLRRADDFHKDIKDCRMRIGDWASDILGKPAFTVATEETEIKLVLVTVADLGFKNGATREDIYKRAQGLGLELCPSEVGPQMRLQYKDQPNDERILIGMEPISGSDGDLSVFCVEHLGDRLWLDSRSGGPGHFWYGVRRWVFARRK